MNTFIYNIINFMKKKYVAYATSLAVFTGVFAGLSAISDNLGIKGSIIRISTIIIISVLSAICVHLFILLLSNKEIAIGKRNASYEVSDSGDNSKDVIAVLAPISSWSTMFYVDIIRGIQQAANKEIKSEQKRIMVIDVPREEGLETTDDFIIRALPGIDALVTINVKITERVCNELYSRNIPVVNAHHQQDNPNSGGPFINSLVPDHTAFKELMDHLFVDMKCEAAVLITKGLKNPYKNARVDPFRKDKRNIYLHAMRTHKFRIQRQQNLEDFDGIIETKNAYILEITQYLFENGEKLFEKVKAIKDMNRNIAFIFLADDTAAGFIYACNNSGISARERGFRVSGFDNTMVAQLLNLTSIDYSLNALGHAIYNKIENYLDYPKSVQYSVEKISTSLVIRESTKWE